MDSKYNDAKESLKCINTKNNDSNSKDRIDTIYSTAKLIVEKTLSNASSPWIAHMLVEQILTNTSIQYIAKELVDQIFINSSRPYLAQYLVEKTLKNAIITSTTPKIVEETLKNAATPHISTQIVEKILTDNFIPNIAESLVKQTILTTSNPDNALKLTETILKNTLMDTPLDTFTPKNPFKNKLCRQDVKGTKDLVKFLPQLKMIMPQTRRVPLPKPWGVKRHNVQSHPKCPPAPFLDNDELDVGAIYKLRKYYEEYYCGFQRDWFLFLLSDWQKKDILH